MIKALSAAGLRSLGRCALEPSDNLGQGQLTLIGPDEPAFWPVFQSSPEFQDDQPDALDRWSRRVLDAIAANAGGQAVYPFGGAPYHPFFSWAARTGQAWPSPIGFLCHADAGLFVSFRGAIILRDMAHNEAINAARSSAPCVECAKPCAVACPVGAFDGGYDVAACKAHVASPQGANCRNAGCLARRACPVGQGLRLPEQAAFHMEAFL